MDTTHDMVYRAFTLNDASIEPDPLTGAAGTGITGSVVDTFDLSDVDLQQFMEKKALQDGMDVGDVYQGSRRLRLAGTLYGRTRADLFDIWDEFLAATNAVLAQREEPGDFGYRPLTFTKPTARLEYTPDLLIPLKVLAMPRSRQVIAQRDNLGGNPNNALAVPWQASFVMRDPVVYSVDPVEVSLVGGSTGLQTWTNRGNYIASPNFLIVVGSAAGSITINLGGSVVTINVQASTGNRTLRYKGRDSGGPAFTVEENSVELPRFDWLDMGTQQAHPVVAVGTSTYQITFTTVVPTTGSKVWFNESYA